MTHAQEIRNEIKNAGGMKTFTAYEKRTRPLGCPMIKNMIPSLRELTREEIYIAFRMGLIGNNSTKGTLVENSTNI